MYYITCELQLFPFYLSLPLLTPMACKTLKLHDSKDSLRDRCSNYMMMNFLLIFKGSIIEGACLSRIFHLGHQSLELEADVMYIVGCIDEKISQEVFEVEFSFFC